MKVSYSAIVSESRSATSRASPSISGPTESAVDAEELSGGSK
jgi:hypothetical protein